MNAKAAKRCKCLCPSSCARRPPVRTVVRFFRVKMSENHTLRIFVSIVDLRVTKESKMELGTVCDLSVLVCVSIVLSS